MNASVELQSAKGSRTLALQDFLIGPGKTAIAGDEILIGVDIPAARGFQDYTMVGPRNAQFYVTASAALVVDEPSRSVRLGLGNAAPKATRASRAEAFANGAIDWNKRSVPRAVAAEFGKLAAADCDPPSDVTCGADYRRHAVKVMARRLIERAFEEEK